MGGVLPSGVRRSMRDEGNGSDVPTPSEDNRRRRRTKMELKEGDITFVSKTT